jgi:hypothetical protein
MAAIRLFAAGNTRPTVAKALVRHMYPDIWQEDRSLALRLTRKKLRAWEETTWFRDAVYDRAIAHTDSQLPQILRGMTNRAKRRVDAARLVLEVTGRHNPRGQEVQPAVVQIQFGGSLPRPNTRPQIEDGTVVEGEVVEETD